MIRIKGLFIALFAFSLLFVVACSSAETEESDAEMETTEAPEAEAPAEPEMEETPTIVGVAAGNENFSTLVAAVQAAELVETLNAEGPYTVFAPTNAAFAKLPEGTVEGLLEPESKETLTSILTYHVVSGKVMAADVVKAIQDGGGSFEVATVQGGTLTASLEGENVILTDAAGNTSTVVIADVAASNGVIHAIDAVVMPQ